MKINKQVMYALLKDISLSNLSQIDRLYINSILLNKLKELEDNEVYIDDYVVDIEDELDEHRFSY